MQEVIDAEGETIHAYDNPSGAGKLTSCPLSDTGGAIFCLPIMHYITYNYSKSQRSPKGGIFMKKSLRVVLAVMVMVCLLSLGAAAEAVSITGNFSSGRVGEEYSSRVYASGGTAPYRWTLVGGTIPSGLNAFPEGDDDDALGLTGTPTTAGRYPLTLQAEDVEGEKITRSFTITISEGSSSSNDDDSGSTNNFSSNGDSSSGGCDSGLAGLGLMLVAGVFLRKSRKA